MHSIKCFSAVPVGDNRQIGITIENVTQFKHSTTWLARTTSNMNAPDKVGPTLKVAKPLQLTNEATNAWTLMVTHIITMKYAIYFKHNATWLAGTPHTNMNLPDKAETSLN